MKLEISHHHLMLLISALNDAIKFNEAFLESGTAKDVSGYMEHLLSLERCQDWLEGEYRGLVNNNLTAYEQKSVKS